MFVNVGTFKKKNLFGGDINKAFFINTLSDVGIKI